MAQTAVVVGTENLGTKHVLFPLLEGMHVVDFKVEETPVRAVKKTVLGGRSEWREIETWEGGRWVIAGPLVFETRGAAVARGEDMVAVSRREAEKILRAITKASTRRREEKLRAKSRKRKR